MYKYNKEDPVVIESFGDQVFQILTILTLAYFAVTNTPQNKESEEKNLDTSKVGTSKTNNLIISNSSLNENDTYSALNRKSLRESTYGELNRKKLDVDCYEVVNSDNFTLDLHHDSSDFFDKKQMLLLQNLFHNAVGCAFFSIPILLPGIPTFKYIIINFHSFHTCSLLLITS